MDMNLFFQRAEKIGASHAAIEFRLPCYFYGADSEYYSTAVEIEPGSVTLFRQGWADRWDADTMPMARAKALTADLEYPL